MDESLKIGILGGDERQITMARRLAEKGIECAAWGLGDTADIGNAVKCRTPHSALNGSRAVVLPMPFSRDGVNLNAPLEEREKLKIQTLYDMLTADTMIIGGKFDLDTLNFAKQRNIRVFDLNDNEEFLVKNAVPTAEGAIEIAIRESKITLFGANVLLLGYGRISRVLLPLLKSFFCEISVVARRTEQLAFASVCGVETAKFFDGKYVKIAQKADIIFNTVPAEVLPKNIIKKLKKSCVIIDLATGGGTDFSYAEECGIKAIHALALPGKVAPVSAGNIMCDCVLSLLKNERGMA